MAYNSRTADKFVVRMPDGMREAINEVAIQNNRSMNSEIISRLNASLAQDGVDDPTPRAETGEEVDWIPQVGQLVLANKIYGTIEDITCLRTGECTIKLRGLTQRYPLDVCAPVKFRRVAHAR